ncbi:MAG: hypothetical protein ACLT3Y_08130 [Ruminococcus callidus]
MRKSENTAAGNHYDDTGHDNGSDRFAAADGLEPNCWTRAKCTTSATAIGNEPSVS